MFKKKNYKTFKKKLTSEYDIKVLNKILSKKNGGMKRYPQKPKKVKPNKRFIRHSIMNGFFFRGSQSNKRLEKKPFNLKSIDNMSNKKLTQKQEEEFIFNQEQMLKEEYSNIYKMLKKE